MKVTYTPEGQDAPQVWDWDPGKIRESAAEIIEKRFGGTYDEFKMAVAKGAARARRVLLWHLIARDHHTLRFEDAPDPYRHELEVAFDRGELLQIIDALQSAEMSDEDRAEALAAFHGMLAGLPGEDEEAEGKAPSNDSGSATA